jgi:hypothetical protein
MTTQQRQWISPLLCETVNWQTNIVGRPVNKANQPLKGQNYENEISTHPHRRALWRTVLAKEPVDFLDPELRGLAARIGIRKDKPFALDARMKAILTRVRGGRQRHRPVPLL